MTTLELIKTLLEMGFFIAGIVVCIISIMGLEQLKLLKHDIVTRNQRAAAEKAIEIGDRFTTVCLPLINAWDVWQAKNERSTYSGPYSDFSFEKLSPEQQREAEHIYKVGPWKDTYNALAGVAAAFTHGIADEEVGYHIFGGGFCQTIESIYPMLCIADYISMPSCVPIITLYKIWSPRLKSARLRKEQEKLRGELESGPIVKAIGTK